MSWLSRPQNGANVKCQKVLLMAVSIQGELTLTSRSTFQLVLDGEHKEGS